MAKLDPKTFFLWDQPRLLIDIRDGNSFLKGSLDNAISAPLAESESSYDLVNKIPKPGSGQDVHLMDHDGRRSAELSREMDVNFLEGGYRFFKAWRESAFEKGPRIRILGGYTGSGKTELLHRLRTRGHQVLDLEEMALHKGSAFGASRERKQPLHEDFQNRLLRVWLMLDPSLPVWIEEKGPFLGMVGIPGLLHKNMQNASMVILDVPFNLRLDYVQKTYGSFEPRIFRKALQQLEPRMGTRNAHKAWHYFESGQTGKCFEILLAYYDSAYDKRRSASWTGNAIHVKHDNAAPENTLMALEQMLKKETRSVYRGNPHSEELM